MTGKSITTKPAKPACKSFEGCHGLGWVYDLSDSGSGRTCYCDCEAGEELEKRESLSLSELVDRVAIYLSETSDNK